MPGRDIGGDYRPCSDHGLRPDLDARHDDRPGTDLAGTAEDRRRPALRRAHQAPGEDDHSRPEEDVVLENDFLGDDAVGLGPGAFAEDDALFDHGRVADGGACSDRRLLADGGVVPDHRLLADLGTRVDQGVGADRGSRADPRRAGRDRLLGPVGAGRDPAEDRAVADPDPILDRDPVLDHDVGPDLDASTDLDPVAEEKVGREVRGAERRQGCDYSSRWRQTGSWGSRGSAACCTASTRWIDLAVGPPARPPRRGRRRGDDARPAGPARGGGGSRRDCGRPDPMGRRGAWRMGHGEGDRRGERPRDRPLGLRGDARVRAGARGRRPGRALRPPAADAAGPLARDRGRWPAPGPSSNARWPTRPRSSSSVAQHIAASSRPPSAFRTAGCGSCRRRFRCRSSSPCPEPRRDPGSDQALAREGRDPADRRRADEGGPRPGA